VNAVTLNAIMYERRVRIIAPSIHQHIVPLTYTVSLVVCRVRIRNGEIYENVSRKVNLDSANTRGTVTSLTEHATILEVDLI